MTLTKEQYLAAVAIRKELINAVSERVYVFEEPMSLDSEESRIVAGGIVDDLLELGFIDLAAVESAATG